jgi:hypothetical protein
MFLGYATYLTHFFSWPLFPTTVAGLVEVASIGLFCFNLKKMFNRGFLDIFRVFLTVFFFISEGRSAFYSA